MCFSFSGLTILNFLCIIFYSEFTTSALSARCPYDLPLLSGSNTSGTDWFLGADVMRAISALVCFWNCRKGRRLHPARKCCTRTTFSETCLPPITVQASSLEGGPRRHHRSSRLAKFSEERRKLLHQLRHCRPSHTYDGSLAFQWKPTCIIDVEAFMN